MPPAKNSGGRCGIGNVAGKPNNFGVPCTMYIKAAMILRMLRRYGGQRFIGAPFTSKDRAVAESVLVNAAQAIRKP
jgi:hypothetical protein